MFFKFLCFFALILSWSCTKSETMPTDMTKNDTIRYLALGDSYTIGESVTTNESYPMLLAAELRGQGVSIASPKIIAKTGWTTDELSAAMDAEKLDSNYNLVSLLIGVNNQYRYYSPENYRNEFRFLLLRAIDLARGNKKRVFVLSIPDWAYTPFGQSCGRNVQEITAQINIFNAINFEMAREYDVTYFDITPITREGLINPALVATDGLHPSAASYVRWTSLMWQDVLKKVKP